MKAFNALIISLGIWFLALASIAVFSQAWILILISSGALTIVASWTVVSYRREYDFWNIGGGLLSAGLGLMFSVLALGLSPSPPLQHFAQLGFPVSMLIAGGILVGLLLYSALISTDWGRRKINYLTVKEIILMLQMGDVDQRKLATALLAEIGTKQAVEPLTHALTDPNASVREGAIQALVQLKAIDSLLRAAGKVEPDIQETVVHALRMMNPPLRVLLLLCVRSADPDVRKGAVCTLTAWDDSAIAPLIQALQDEDRQIRAYAALILGERCQREALAPLISRLKDQALVVRLEAAIALGQLGEVDSAIPLAELLNDEDGEVAAAAAWALGELGDARAISLLRQLVQDSSLDTTRSQAREAAIAALERIEPKMSC